MRNLNYYVQINKMFNYKIIMFRTNRRKDFASLFICDFYRFIDSKNINIF